MDLNEMEKGIVIESQIQLDQALTGYYRDFPDPSLVEGIQQEYENGKIEHITIPAELQKDGNTWAPILDKYLRGEAKVSTHAETKHTADSILSIRIIREELEKGNVLTNVKEPKAYEDFKDTERNRVRLETHDLVERNIERHLHTQMALELRNQVESDKIDKTLLKKSLEKLSKTDPGFTTILACELVSLSPISSHKLYFNIDDVLDIVDNFSHNRQSDRTFLYEIYNTIAGKNVFSKEETDKAANIVLTKFPNEKESLERKLFFKDLVKPIIVFEASLNILAKEIFPKRNIRLEPFVMKKLYKYKLADSVTSHIVTAYVEHTPKLSLGPANIMLSSKTLNRLLSIPHASFDKT